MPADPGSIWTAKDVIQFCSLPLSLFVAWLTTRWNFRNQRRLLLAQEVTRQIGEITTGSRLVVEDIERHLCGDYDGGFSVEKACESRKRIMVAMKALDRRVAQLKGLVSTAESQWLLEKFDKWKRGLTSDPFPVLRIEEAQTAFAPPIAAAQEAEDHFESALSEVRKRYIKL